MTPMISNAPYIGISVLQPIVSKRARAALIRFIVPSPYAGSDLWEPSQRGPLALCLQAQK